MTFFHNELQLQTTKNNIHIPVQFVTILLKKVFLQLLKMKQFHLSVNFYLGLVTGSCLETCYFRTHVMS